MVGDDYIHLSLPHMGGEELQFVKEAFDANWIAPLGHHVDEFEREFCESIDCDHAAALNSGTSALHLALILCGVSAGDDVLVSTLTFSASVNPILYVGANPVFIDSERDSWNMDPSLLAETIEARVRMGRKPKAVIVVHLYGQCANMYPIMEICDYHGVPVIEDAAEALGATYHGRAAGTFGLVGAFSFNGNKIITTGGGGMLVSANDDLIIHARKLASQSRDPAPHYQHSEIGYNYRLSNVLAGIGRGQLKVLGQHVNARRRNFNYYSDALGALPGIEFMPEAPWGCHTRWLTTLTISPSTFGASREQVRLALLSVGIEARPVWKPMHQQPVFSTFECVTRGVADDLFQNGLCLPSGSQMKTVDLDRVISAVESVFSG